MRRENLPSLNEVAAVLKNENIALEKRKIVIAQKGTSDFTVIHAGHPAYFPMGYPLLWPYGDPGWTYEYSVHNPKTDRKIKITRLEYLRYVLHYRPGQPNYIFRGRFFL
jgi:hypothetical protein